MSVHGPFPPAGWYPDPAGAPRQRYWNGTAWTEHYHPPVVAAPPPPTGAPVSVVPPRRGRTGLVLGIVGGAMALVIGVVVTLVVALPKAPGGAYGQIHTDVSAEYDYTDPMLGLPEDYEFEFPADYDLAALNIAHGDEFSADWAFEVFYDDALTRRADAWVSQSAPGAPVTIHGMGSPTVFDGDTIVPIASDGLYSWKVHDQFFLVRKVDRSGDLLAKPVVTRFTVTPEMAPPVVTFSTPEADGNVTLSWQPVDGAREYLIVASSVETSGDIRMSRDYRVLDIVDGTEWSSSSATESGHREPWVEVQNAGMQLFDFTSSDDLAGTGMDPWSHRGEQDIGVIATDGTRFSPYISHDAVSRLAALPYERAEYASADLKVVGPSGLIEGMHNVQTRFPFTSLDGATRTTVAQIDAANVVELDDRWRIPLVGRGTMLGEWVDVLKSTVPDIRAAVAEFNAAAEASAPATGMPEFDLIAAPVDEFAEGDASTPDIPYPVYGSTELTRFLGAHLIAQTPVVDVSAFVAQPGAPDVMDALWEAIYQNPYALQVDGANVSLDGTRVFLDYRHPTEEAAELQAQIHGAVEDVVASVVHDGMSASDRVVALNDWLAANAEYDYPALTASDLAGGIPDGEESAWHAGGVLLEGAGVCASYAEAFAALANAAGVETVVVEGDVLDGGRHAWNKVLIDGTWLAVDPTWNDSTVPNQYLMISDSGFTGPATRTQGDLWMIDRSIGAYVTP